MTASATPDERAPHSRPRPPQAGHRERLRQRLSQAGPTALADYELLELLLSYAIPRRDVKPLAKALLAYYGDLARVLAAPPASLQAQPGIGPRAAMLIHLAGALPARLQTAASHQAGPQPLPDDATLAAYARLRLAAGSREQVLVLYFGPSGEWLRHEEVAEGGTEQAVVFPRQIAESALARRALAVAIIHTHPSGHCLPSAADLQFTQTLVAALALLEIRLHEHLILAGGSHFSFRAQGLIPG